MPSIHIRGLIAALAQRKCSMKTAAKMVAMATSLCLPACGQTAPPASTIERHAPPSIAALERAQGLASTGVGRDWQGASPDERRAFAFAALTGLEVFDPVFEVFDAGEDDDNLIACLDHQATEAPEQPLAKLAADCANSVLGEAVAQQLAPSARVARGEITEADFEACRPEVARLIYGRVSDWRIAIPECRVAYAMTSIAAAQGAPTRDPSSVRIFLSCVNRLTENSPGYEHLADSSRHCALAP